jgi:hypothetical protein
VPVGLEASASIYWQIPWITLLIIALKWLLRGPLSIVRVRWELLQLVVSLINVLSIHLVSKAPCVVRASVNVADLLIHVTQVHICSYLVSIELHEMLIEHDIGWFGRLGLWLLGLRLGLCLGLASARLWGFGLLGYWSGAIEGRVNTCIWPI